MGSRALVGLCSLALFSCSSAVRDGSDGGGAAGLFGGSGAGGGAGAAGSGSAGTAGAGGASGVGGAGTNATAGAGGAGGGAAECPAFDAAFIDSLRTCSVDADCEPVRSQQDCCGTYMTPAVAKSQSARFFECAPASSSFPACGCAAQPSRADDGRIIERYDLSDVGARCTGGKCESFVSARTCGASGLLCDASELCVVYETLVGPSTNVDFACVDNPCAEALACACALSVCQLRTDVTRACTIDSTPDVYCVDLSSQ